MIRDAGALLGAIRSIHAAIRDAVVVACERSAVEQLAEAVGDEGGDTIYEVDRVSERVLLERFAEVADRWSCVLIAEGLGATGRVTLPHGTADADAELRIIVDPIDGTRGLMYQKRPAWILTGVAPNRGEGTSLRDITVAVQTEIPLVRQHLSDAFWVVDGAIGGERFDRLTRTVSPLLPRPSRAPSVDQGFGGLARFFPGARAELAAVDDAVVARVLGPQPRGRALAFEDQYISTGGQLYELLVGHDRWIADLRPLVGDGLLCCHPYDVCTESIARAAGVVVTDAHGAPLDAPLDVHADVAWIGYANTTIAERVGRALGDVLRERGLLRPDRQA